MAKYIDAERLRAEIERLIKVNQELESSRFTEGIAAGYGDVLSAITSLQQEYLEVSVECSVRVYSTLDNKSRPWVSLYKHGISCDSIKDIPELENLGFKDDDTAIVTIKKKNYGKIH